LQGPALLPTFDEVSIPPAVLALHDLTKGFRRGSTPILNHLRLELRPLEYLAIMGESGAGKSTLLNLIAGLDRPDAGRVLFEGLDLTAMDDEAITRLRRARMGFVFQAFHVLPYLKVWQNVALPLDLLGTAPAERRARAQHSLETLGLGALAERYPRELSGGELQRTAIARALVHQPRLVLADEPTGNLDARSAAQVLALLRAQLQQHGAAGILITHSLSAARTADRILQLSGGQLHPVAVGDMDAGAALAAPA
jgi:putative ABC transport system ATP-binding protein